MVNKRAIIATGNPNKLREIREILKEFNLKIISLKDLALENLKIIEDGNSFEENALIKARRVMEETGYMTIADDSGLEVEYLNWKPGIHSARFAGERATDAKNNEKLLKLLKNVPPEKRGARFVCVIAVIMPNGESFTVRGDLYGSIAYEPKGNKGFGYDPIFLLEDYNGLSLGGIEADIKNKISHRGQALEKMKRLLSDKLRGNNG